MAIFTDVFEDVTKQGRKIPTSDYHENGLHPIIDQGQSVIAGYTDEKNGLFTDVPAIIFGDHTRVLKYVDTPCFLGADGVKLLKAKLANPNYKYLYYVLSNANIPNTGYNRHFKWLKEVEIPLPSESEQRKIVEILDKISELIALRKEQLAKLDQLVKSRFVELFGSPIANDYGWPVSTLGELCLKITDGEHQNPQFVDSGIPMVMANNVQDKGIVFDGCRYISAENYMKFSRKCCPEFGDVLLVSRGATIGRCCINSESTPFSLMGSVILIKNNKERISSAYLVNWLKNEEIKPMIYTTSSASAQQAIYMKDLVVRKVAVPPMELQEQYTAFVEQTDKSKLAIQQSLDKLELLKKSLMQEYFG